jgi:hypothetical protein
MTALFPPFCSPKSTNRWRALIVYNCHDYKSGHGQGEPSLCLPQNRSLKSTSRAICTHGYAIWVPRAQILNNLRRVPSSLAFFFFFCFPESIINLDQWPVRKNIITFFFCRVAEPSSAKMLYSRFTFIHVNNPVGGSGHTQERYGDNLTLSVYMLPICWPEEHMSRKLYTFTSGDLNYKKIKSVSWQYRFIG